MRCLSVSSCFALLVLALGIGANDAQAAPQINDAEDQNPVLIADRELEAFVDGLIATWQTV
jgi:hypothetical protein